MVEKTLTITQITEILDSLKDKDSKGRFDDTYRNYIIDRCIKKIKEGS